MMKKIVSKLGITLLSLALLASSAIFAPFSPIKTSFGATIPTPVASFSTSLATSMSASDTSMSLVSITTDDGTTLTNGSTYGFVIDEGTSSEEFVVGTVNTASLTVTSMTRGVSTITGNTAITALQKTHRRGATVKITDHPVLTVLSRIINGNETLPNPITYATGVAPVSGSDLADKDYVLSVVTGGAITYDKVIVSGTAGETLAAGNFVYLKSTDSRWYLTDADAASTSENLTIGIAQGAGTTGNSISGGVLIRGIDVNQTGLTANTVYYLSGTAGAISSTAGTKEVTVGIALSTTSILLDKGYNQQITEDEQDALAGTTGIPTSSNKYATQDNLSVGTTLDQSQTTQNSSIEFGEANVTTKKNLIAQSFVPTRTKISAVYINKQADTGTFTGTVTISLQADSAGSPSGSDLASKVFTNTEWEALATGENIATFSTEYASLVAGSTYWIVGTASTSDSSNHPNIGTNTAGGYSSGSIKYKNATDGWVAVSTTDLYFKTAEGVASQIVKTNTTGKIESAFYDVTEMPLPAFNQHVSISSNSDTGGTSVSRTTSNQSGSILIIEEPQIGLVRLARDSVTGQYFPTHSVGPTGSSTGKLGLVVLGDYVYYFYDNGATMASRRLDLADLTNETAMTIGTSIDTSGGVAVNSNAFTDGKYIYVQQNGGTTFHKLSVSGTTFTQVTTITVDGAFDNNDSSFFFDGTKVVMVECIGVGPTGNYRMTRFTDATATPTLTTFGIGTMAKDSIGTSGTRAPVVANIDTTRMYVGQVHLIYDNATDQRIGFSIFPISKP